MEKNIKIKISKKLSIYGKFNGSYKQPLFIIIHGLTGNMDEELYQSATHWFRKNGFSTFRFNLYSYQKDARQLMNCTLKTHSKDLDKIVNYFKNKGVQNIFIAGHSFGGPVILGSKKQNFNAAVLWDPTYKISFIKKAYGFPKGKYVKELKAYITKWGVNFVISRAMAKEVESFPQSLAVKEFNIPFQIILAGAGVLHQAKKYLRGVKVEHDLIIIKNATHYFNDTKDMRKKVFRYSMEWFKKFM